MAPIRLRLALQPTSPSGIRRAHHTLPGRRLSGVQSFSRTEDFHEPRLAAIRDRQGYACARRPVIQEAVLLDHGTDQPDGLPGRFCPQQTVRDERRCPVIAVGPDATLVTRQSLAHRQELDGDAYAMFI